MNFYRATKNLVCSILTSVLKNEKNVHITVLHEPGELSEASFIWVYHNLQSLTFSPDVIGCLALLSSAEDLFILDA